MLSSQEVDLTDTILSQSNSLFETISDSKEIDKLDDFVENSLLLNSYLDITVHKALRVLDCRTDNRLLIVKVTYQASIAKRVVNASELQLIGLKTLDWDFGHILIRPETIEDKINEFFNKCELDFRNYPDFSSKYYFLSKDRNLGISFATSSRLELMQRQNEILIEVKGNILVSKYPRILNSVDFINMLDLIKEI